MFGRQSPKHRRGMDQTWSEKRKQTDAHTRRPSLSAHGRISHPPLCEFVLSPKSHACLGIFEKQVALQFKMTNVLYIQHGMPQKKVVFPSALFVVQQPRDILYISFSFSLHTSPGEYCRLHRIVCVCSIGMICFPTTLFCGSKVSNDSGWVKTRISHLLRSQRRRSSSNNESPI